MLHWIKKWLGFTTTPVPVPSLNAPSPPPREVPMYPKTRAGLKQELKDLAQNIRTVRGLFKEEQRNLLKGEGCGVPSYVLGANLRAYRQSYRHRHIALGILRGRLQEQIEKPKKGNEPDAKEIKKIVTEYLEQEKAHEALRDSQV